MFGGRYFIINLYDSQEKGVVPGLYLPQVSSDYFENFEKTVFQDSFTINHLDDLVYCTSCPEKLLIRVVTNELKTAEKRIYILVFIKKKINI